MGLSERRAIEDFKANNLPGLTSEIEKLAGAPVPIEVRWEQIAYEAKEFKKGSTHYNDVWTKLFFTPVIDALTRIGRDPMGKAALAGGIKKIIIENVSRSYSPTSAIKFEAGVITIDHDYSNVADVKGRTDHLVKLIEAAL